MSQTLGKPVIGIVGSDLATLRALARDPARRLQMAQAARALAMADAAERIADIILEESA